MSKKDDTNEKLGIIHARKKKIVVGVRQQQRRIKFAVKEMEEQLFQDCRALPQSAT
ncbi:Uncharacterized protein APZ42_005171, partial [Daphnia magna]